MPKMICICILLIYFKVISKKGGHYCPRLPYTFGDRLNVVDRCENSHWDKGLKGIDCHSFMYMNRQ